MGNLTAALTAKGMMKNLVFVYSADNGGTDRGSNWPLRGSKHSNCALCHSNLFEPSVAQMAVRGLGRGGRDAGRCVRERRADPGRAARHALARRWAHRRLVRTEPFRQALSHPTSSCGAPFLTNHPALLPQCSSTQRSWLNLLRCGAQVFNNLHARWRGLQGRFAHRAAAGRSRRPEQGHLRQRRVSGRRRKPVKRACGR